MSVNFDVYFDPPDEEDPITCHECGADVFRGEDCASCGERAMTVAEEREADEDEDADREYDYRREN